MKRFLASAIALALLFSLASCQKQNTLDNPSSAPFQSDEYISITLSKTEEWDIDATILSNGAIVHPLSEGNSSYKFIDTKSLSASENSYSEIVSLGNGYFWAKNEKDNLYYIVDQRSGIEVSPIGAISHKELSDRFILVRCPDSNHIFDKNWGNFIPNLPESEPVEANSAFIFYSDSTGNIIVYDENGLLLDTYYVAKSTPDSAAFLAIKNIVDDEFLIIGEDKSTIGRIFDQIPNFKMANGSNSLLLRTKVTLGSQPKIEISDLHGNIISRSYSSVAEIADDKYIVASDGSSALWGVDILKGDILIPFEFDEILYLPEGFFQCRRGNDWFLFDKSGNKISSLPFDLPGIPLSDFSDGNTNRVMFLNGKILETAGPKMAYWDGIVLLGSELYNAYNGELLLSGVAQIAKTDQKLYVADTEKKIRVYIIK